MLAAAGAWWLARSTVPAADPATAARTSFPGLPAPTGEPTLPGLESLAPAAGEVAAAPGPFDDRYRFTGLSLAEGEVAGTVEITTEVSELLELEVLAGFYDADGTLVGTGRHVQHADAHEGHAEEGPPPRAHPFVIAVPGDVRAEVVAAAVGVPVLVNE